MIWRNAYRLAAARTLVLTALSVATRKSGIFVLLAVLWLCAPASLPAQTFTTLHSFDAADGEAPQAALVQATDGNLYGATVQGGANCPPYGCGTIFKITPSGTLTTLHSFDGTDGSEPRGLIQATNGNFYGTTVFGGAHSEGTVFEITPSGTLTTLHSFGGADGEYPQAALIQATDGNFYGTSSRGGANRLCPPRRTVTCGTVFKITPSGELTTLASFGEEGGSEPFSPLIQANDGNFYGTTPSTVFKVTPSGTLSTLAIVSSSYAGLVQATDGNFYGTTEYGGNAATCDGGCGTVFKVTPSGTLTTLLSFTNSANPVAALIQATDGSLYGTTGVGGANNDCGGSAPGPIGCGTVFKVTLGGTLTTLFSFDSTDGAGPQAALVQATNGEFYGTTAVGGASAACNSQGDVGCGTVFSLSLGLGPFVETQPGSGAAGTTVKILGTDLTGAASVNFNGAEARFTVVSSSEITATVPAGTTTGKVEVATPSGMLSSNVSFQVP
jgi:uncharacterized repeat protein (TIGR03803 family)